MSDSAGPPLHRVMGTGGSDPMRAGIGADDALVGLALAGPAARTLDRIRLAPMVGGALRAALDCLLPDSRVATPARVSADGGALEVRLESIAPEGLAPAGGVLETVEGHLGRVPGSRGAWMVRVPVLALDETFLLIEQGGLGLALPWHSVARMRLSAPDQLRAIADQDGYGVLEPMVPLEDTVAERPAVLLGLGLRRAWLAADRVVWRMTAVAVDGGPARPGLGPMVRSADGGLYMVYDAARRLRSVALPPLPHVEPAFPPDDPTHAPDALPAGSILAGPPLRGDVAPAMLEAEEHDESTEEPAEELAEEPAEERPVLRLVELRPEDVEPLEDGEPAPGAPADAPSTADSEVMEFVPDESEPAPPPPDDDLPEWTEAAPGAHTASPSPPPAMPDSAPRRVLVAEDSIIARIFLVRLLEQDGYVVDAIGSGHELVHAAGRVPWWVVFADTDLPDAVAGSALGRLAPRRADGTPAPVVALVRDADDVRAAAMAGITHTLAKPYEQDALRALLRLLDEPGAPPEPR